MRTAEPLTNVTNMSEQEFALFYSKTKRKSVFLETYKEHDIYANKGLACVTRQGETTVLNGYETIAEAKAFIDNIN